MIFPEIASFHPYRYFFSSSNCRNTNRSNDRFTVEFFTIFPSKIRSMVTLKRKKKKKRVYRYFFSKYHDLFPWTTLIGLECYWVASRGLVNFYIYFEKKLTNGVVLLSYGDVTSPRHRGNSFAPRNELGNASLRSAGFSQLRLLSRGHIRVYIYIYRSR